MSIRNLTSIVGARGLPAPSTLTSLIWITPSEDRLLPAAESIFGGVDANKRDVAYMFGTARLLQPTGSYIATIEDALISPSGLIFTDNQVIYESAYPWQIENMHSQFGKDFEDEEGDWTPKTSTITEYESLFFCREGGEVGFFHFINSIIPKIGLYLRLHAPEVRPLVNNRQRFAAEFLAAYGIADFVEPRGWMKVKKLYYPSPFTIEGDHFTRPAFGYKLIHEVIKDNAIAVPSKSRRIYLSRNDAPIRRLTNESELTSFLKRHDFEVLTIGNMSMVDQINLFKETGWLISPHGAGLSNIVWMAPETVVTEIVSPTRLWPTFRTLAARAGLKYHAIIGTHIDGSEPPLPEGNEHFTCDMWDARMSVSQTIFRESRRVV